MPFLHLPKKHVIPYGSDKKPAMAVEVDYRNPIARKLFFCLPFTKFQPWHDVGHLGLIGDPKGNTPPTFDPAYGYYQADEQTAESSSNHDRVDFGTVSHDRFHIGATGEGLSVAFKHNSTSNPAASFCRYLEHSNGSQGTNGWTIYWNTINTRIGVDAAAVQPVVQSAENDFAKGSTHSVMVYMDGGGTAANCKVYLDGVDKSSTGSNWTPAAASVPLTLGGLGWTAATTIKMPGTIPYMYVWDRQISAFEAMSIHKNPYQVLKPRSATVYSFPSSVNTSITVPTGPWY